MAWSKFPLFEQICALNSKLSVRFKNLWFCLSLRAQRGNLMIIRSFLEVAAVILFPRNDSRE